MSYEETPRVGVDPKQWGILNEIGRRRSETKPSTKAGSHMALSNWPMLQGSTVRTMSQ